MTRNIHLHSDLYRAVKAMLLAEKGLNSLSMGEIQLLTQQLVDEIDKYIEYQVGKVRSKENV